MPRFGHTSIKRLNGVHPSLIKIASDVVAEYDITVLKDGGARTPGRQAELVASEASKTMRSKHVIQPDGYSHAIDIAPYPIDWNDRERFYYMAGLFKMAAKKHGVKIRWGGCWKGDNDFKDNSWDDLPHMELVT